MATSTQSRGPLKILIVEDNRDARTTLRMLLTMAYGHAVIEAGEGLSAIRLAVEQRPDVALIDLGLPDIDGYEVARRIRESLPRNEIFLAALTGYSDDDDRARTEEAGFDVHLVKPVESAALAKLLSHVAAAGATQRE
jgi:CheY-like chemotaxis protein